MEVPDLVHIPNEGDRNSVDGLPRHEEVIHEYFSRDIDPLDFQPHADVCCDSLTSLQGGSKVVEANVDGIVSPDRPHQLGASDWPPEINLRDGEINNLIGLLIDEDRASTTLAICKSMSLEMVPADPYCFWLDYDEDPNPLVGGKLGRSSRLAKCEEHSFDSFSRFVATFQDHHVIQESQEIVYGQSHVRICQFLTQPIRTIFNGRFRDAD
jgi:hypothetical protein